MSNTKIALYIPALETGGIERSLINTANLLSELNHHVVLITYSFSDVVSTNIRGDIEVINLQKNRVTLTQTILAWFFLEKSVKALYTIWSAKNAIRTCKPDIIIAFQSGTILAFILRFLGDDRPKFVLRESNTPSLALRSHFIALKEIKVILKKWAYKRADRLIAISEGVAKDMRDNFAAEPSKICVIYNPTVSEHLLTYSRKQKNKELLKPDVVNLVSVGRLVYQKDQETLLRAFRELVDIRKAHLTIIGEGEDRAKLEKLAADLALVAHVTFLGKILDPYPVIRAADIFVLSPRFEGLGNVFIEALALGTPVISTDCPSGPREILMNGKAGLLAPVGDILALKNALLTYVDDTSLREEHLQYGALYSVPRFTTASVKRKFDNLLRSWE
jgi:glycosyltransferase involved in cell wall biosynthesis